jgi:cytochrome o ubiquinol oxidase subunit II
MPKSRKRNSQGKTVSLILLAIVGLTLLIKTLLQGNNVTLLDPKGVIAHDQLSLMIFTAALLLTIAIPAVFLLFFTAWKYRESNHKAVHDPDTRHSKLLVLNMWLIPSVFMFVLAVVMWPATHILEPQKQIASTAKPLTIQVVSMRWKWVFIYPNQNIATVNFVQMPVDTPVRFELTADAAPMSSFWIPNLGGQLYAMTGMVNHLNLMADTPGDYPGSSAEINGAGFAGMKFIARASSQDDFDRWVQGVKRSPDVLDAAEYDRLLKPSEDNPAAFYSTYDSGLYDKVLMKYTGPSADHMNMMDMQHE